MKLIRSRKYGAWTSIPMFICICVCLTNYLSLCLFPYVHSHQKMMFSFFSISNRFGTIFTISSRFLESVYKNCLRETCFMLITSVANHVSPIIVIRFYASNQRVRVGLSMTRKVKKNVSPFVRPFNRV